ncbi:MAG TPA: iron-hydroxamate ABC transporter substrate-binding protein [Virgibacillus sp.]|nr:iron-hydroxamate ABC transporter substrate-binding protein [Virgibacillus sp.]
MKKKVTLILLLSMLFINACSNGSENEANNKTNQNNQHGGDEETITYESENGPVEVPADPQRVVVLSSYAGDLINLDVPIVGADSWSMDNPNFEEALKDAEEVSDESIEKILELEPDLIIGLSNIKNYDKLNEIAPTVTFTYGKADYLQQHIEIGKLVNKEDEATEWAEDFEQRAASVGDKIRDKIGEDTTVSVLEGYDKQFYVYGDNWGRGTEILYQAMGLKMPDKVEEMTEEEGYYALSHEAIPEYAGDYLILSEEEKTDNLKESNVFKDIPAVKDDQVLQVDMDRFYFNDATTLDYQLDVFEDYFLDQ